MFSEHTGNLRTAVFFAAILQGIALLPGMAHAQAYPNKPIRLVTASPGNAQDFAARLLAEELRSDLGQAVIVDNRGGGVIPGEVVFRAAPDGYTLLVGGTAIWIQPLLGDKVGYDPIKDFAPITLAFNTPSVVVVNPSVAANSIKELIALAKASPGKLNYSSGPNGGSPHIAGELFKSMAGVNIVHIAYKGAAEALTDLMGGRVQVSFPTAAAVAPFIKSGKLRALAVTSAERSVLVPDLPTVAEAAGLPGYEVQSITAIFAPAKTPQDIVRMLNQEIVKTLKKPEISQKIVASGADVVGSSPEQLGQKLREDIARVGKLIKEAGITAN